MPKYKDNTSQAITVKNNTGNFGFSAIRIEDLQSSEYTLVQIAVDCSGSTAGFTTPMEEAIKQIVESCRKSPRADNLLLRLIRFDDNSVELIGWEMLNGIDLARFDGILTPGGMTALYDAAIDGIEATSNFGRQLLEQDYAVNGIVFVITDGCENRSKLVNNDPNDSAKYVREAFKKAITGENLESLVSILIAVNATDPGVDRELQKFFKEAGFTQYVDMKDANAKTLAKLAKFVSDSISSQSQALGTGGPSQTLPAPTF